MSLIHEVSELFEIRSGSASIHPTWKVIELSKVCKIQNGFPFQSAEFNSISNGTPLIRIRDILKHNPETFFKGSFNESYLVKKGDLLVGMDGDFNHSLWKGPDALLNQRVCRIIPNQKILLNKFLYYGLGDYLKIINDNTSSTTVKHLSSRSIGEIPFALPPFSEQQRIVAKLDAIFWHLDVLREKLDRIPVLLKNFRQQVLTQAVTGELTREWREGEVKKENLKIKNKFKIEFELFEYEMIPDSWEYTALGNYAECSRGKFSIRPRNDSRYFDGEYPFVQIGDLPKEGGNVSTFSKTLNNLGKVASKEFKSGTVLIAIVGATIGNTGILTRNMFFPDSLIGINSGCINSNQFVEYFLRSIKLILRQLSYAGGGQPNIKLNNIQNLAIALPPIEEQQEIIKKVESLFQLSDKIESQYQSLKAKIDQMPQAILAKAFRGELVWQEVKGYVREEGEVLMAAEAEIKMK